MRHLIYATLLLAACSSETGILVGVSGSSVEELVFEVGIAEGDDYVLDLAASGETRDVRGRDLRLDPYELLLRPENPDAPPPQLRVLVLGRRGGKTVSVAVMDPPQGFLPGEVLRRGLLLQGLSSTVTTSAPGKCFVARLSEKASFRLISRSDRDCDGVSPDDTPPDCDDNDSAIRPGAKELCDGKDNNCDGQYLKGSASCYTLVSSDVPCREGTRTCEEKAGDPGSQACAASESSPAVPHGYCEGEKVEPQEASCTVEATSSGLCPGSFELQPPSGSANCTWMLLSDAGWPLTLEGAKAPAAAKACKPSLALSAAAPPAKGTVVLELVAGDPPVHTVVNAVFEAKTVTDCSAEPITCAAP